MLFTCKCTPCSYQLLLGQVDREAKAGREYNADRKPRQQDLDEEMRIDPSLYWRAHTHTHTHTHTWSRGGLLIRSLCVVSVRNSYHRNVVVPKVLANNVHWRYVRFAENRFEMLVDSCCPLHQTSHQAGCCNDHQHCTTYQFVQFEQLICCPSCWSIKLVWCATRYKHSCTRKTAHIQPLESSDVRNSACTSDW
jgi:hypothetical protein